MQRLRIVIDTNVLVSAALKSSGLETTLIELLAYNAFDLYVSEEVLAEYRGVLSRPKFSHIDPRRVARLLILVASAATVVAPTERLAISVHEEDNRFYECADAADADYIVTGNTKHFTKPNKRTKIINVRKLLEQLTAAENE